MEKKLREQNFKNIELGNNIQDLRHDLEEAQSKLAKSESRIKLQQTEKEELESKLKTYFEESSQEHNRLQNSIKEYDLRIAALTQEGSRYKSESEGSAEKLKEILKENNDLQLMLNEAMKMAEDLRIENENLKSLKSEELDQIEKELDQEKAKFETADFERRKMQEELETVTQALEYNSNELIEKKMMLANYTVQNSQMSSRVEELKKQVHGKDELIEALERQISQFNNDENSSFNIALRDNKKMRSDIEDFRARLDNESKKSSAQIHEIERLKGALQEAQRSESDFKIAYHEILEKFQKSNSEAKLRETELNNKNGEICELQKNLNESQNRYNKMEESLRQTENELRELTEHSITERSSLISEIDIQKRLLNSELERQSQSLTRMEERYNQANREMSAQRKEFDATLESSKKDFNATCRKLTESLKMMQNELDRIQKTQVSLEKKGVQSEEQIQQLRDVLDAKESEIKLKNEEIQRYAEKIANLTEKGSQNQTQEISRLMKQNQNFEELIQKEKQKVEALKADLQKKEAELIASNDNLKQLKDQMDGYWETIDQINEKDSSQEEVKKLKKQNENQKEIIEALNRHASDNYKHHEEEISKIRESYSKLDSQHQYIMATASIKETEWQKSKEEMKLMLLEKSKLIMEINGMKLGEKKVKKTIEDLEEKITALSNERLALVLQVDELNKTNTQLAGHNNTEQRIKHLNKLKEENCKLKEEKGKMADKLNKVQDRNDKLQKKIDDLATKLHLDPQKVTEEIDDTQYLQTQYEKATSENRFLFDAFSKLSHLIRISFYYKKPMTVTNNEQKGLETTLNEIQEMINFLAEKDKEVRDREIEIDAKELEYNITKKEFAIIKQKYQLTHSTYFVHANGGALTQDSDAGKENVPINHNLDQRDNLSMLETSAGVTGTAGRGKVFEPSNFDRDSLEKFPNMKKYFEESSEPQQATSDSKTPSRSKAMQKKFEKKMTVMRNISYSDQTGEPTQNYNGMDSMPTGPMEEKISFNRERSDDFSKKFATSSFEGAANRKKVKME